MLKTNRSALVCILLGIITLGIYGLYMIHQMAKDANTADQSSKVGGLLAYILLSIITLGIYSLYWNYKVCEKFANSVRASGGSVRGLCQSNRDRFPRRSYLH